MIKNYKLISSINYNTCQNQRFATIPYTLYRQRKSRDLYKINIPSAKRSRYKFLCSQKICDLLANNVKEQTLQ
jgi:hypothetical protein